MNGSNEFGMYLAKLREANGYRSQRRLAEKAGVSSATLSRIESGLQKPQPETLQALSQHLKGVTYKELMEAAGYPIEDDNKKFDKGTNSLPRTPEGKIDVYADPEGWIEELAIEYKEKNGRELPEWKRKAILELLEAEKQK